MEYLNKALVIGVIFVLGACGVKGRPLPPLNPAPIGRGEATFQEAQKKPTKKITNKNRDKEAEETSEAEK